MTPSQKVCKLFIITIICLASNILEIIFDLIILIHFFNQRKTQKFF